jgi:hypothetical protein
MNLSEFIYDDFLLNHEEIVSELKKPEIDIRFKYRGSNSPQEFSTLDGVGADMYSMFDKDIPKYLKKLIVKTVKFKNKFKPDQIVINKYLPGGYLSKHKDSTGGYWDFNLVFLYSEKSHFTLYDENDNGFLVEEKPGRCVDMPLGIIHESTPLDLDESIKYSLVFIWS